MVNDSCDDFGLSSMTKAKIVSLCKKHKLYVTPRLNDVLYLHYQGFTEIKELDEYVGLKCIYLECNAISEISGLENQSELRCLLLHNNVIKKIENLEHCVHLDSINLSHNFITTIENLGSDILPKLNTLTITNNCLRTEDSVSNLVHCKTLSVLDLSHNRIDDIVIVKILGQMPELRVLVLTGNPVVNQIPSYRKTLIINCKRLTYLDSRPVFNVDRACAEAWKRGGYEEERRERMRWNEEERRKLISSFNHTINTTSNAQTVATETGNSTIDMNGEKQSKSNNDPDTISQIAEQAANYNSDDSKSSHESVNNDLGTPAANYNNDDNERIQISNINDELRELSEVSQLSRQSLESTHSNADKSGDQSKLEGVESEACIESNNIDDSIENPIAISNDSNEILESLNIPCEYNQISDLVLPVTIKELHANIDMDYKRIEGSIQSDCNDDINTCMETENENSSIEFDRNCENSLRSNFTKVTFYCENVNKLMDDHIGEESEEPIQEITSMLDTSI